MQHFASELKDSHRLPIGASDSPLLACGVCGSTVDFFPTALRRSRLGPMAVTRPAISPWPRSPAQCCRLLSTTSTSHWGLRVGADTDICSAVRLADDIAFRSR